MVGVRLLRMGATIAQTGGCVFEEAKEGRERGDTGLMPICRGAGMEDTTPGTYTGHTLSHCARKGDAMEFSQVLRGFVNEAGCTGKELAEACGMSASTVSRYLAGTRTPDAETLPARELAEALCGLAMRAGRTLDAESVQAALLASARGAAPQGAGKKLSALLDTFGVTRAKLAEALGYSASYVSRVCAETRVPSDFAAFAEAAGAFFAERVEAAGTGAPEALAKLCGTGAGTGGNDAANGAPSTQAGEDGGEGTSASGDLARRICAWLCTADDAAQARGTGLEPFLHKLDRFDLDTYLAAMHTAQAMRPASAQQGPDRPEAAAPYRLYTGIDGFCQAELDFLARAAAEPAGTSVVMFSDMPMQDKMQAHPEFPARWLAALAALLRGGHTIDNIHNVGRSLPEIMLGMEAWLPLYMTGMVRPYYLPTQAAGPFAHLVRASESAALEGQAVAGAYEHVGCELFCDPESVAHFKRRAADLLAMAKPLANIYTARQEHELAAFLVHEAAQSGKRMFILSSPPLYTMDEGLLEEALAASQLDEQEKARVRAARTEQLARMEAELAQGEARVAIAHVDEETFAQAAANMALGEAFCGKSVHYKLETYRKHVAQTEEFAAAHPNWHLDWTPDLGFRNIQITVRPGCWALVSKNTSPAVHFVLRHKKMVEAFEHFEMPIVE